MDGGGRGRDPTTDAQAVRALTPLGGAEYGYKGYGLALMIDLLCGPLNGNPWGPKISGMFTALDEPRQHGEKPRLLGLEAPPVADDERRIGGRGLRERHVAEVLPPHQRRQ